MWADRRYVARPDSLLRAYGYVELAIALMGLGVAALLPHLGRVSAAVSSYSRDAAGWYVLSTASYLARVAIALVLLTPITLLMGGTLTLLIRHLVRSDLDTGGRRIAVLYAVNTAGAAVGCFLTDFSLVPRLGFLGAQMIAVGFNLVAGVGALYIARDIRQKVPVKVRQKVRLKPDTTYDVPYDVRSVRLQADRKSVIALTSLALAMSGFAAMGMEIVWFRHLTILLGGFRAVFSLLLTIILIGIGGGSLAASFLNRRTSRPGTWLMVGQALFVASALLGLAIIDTTHIEEAVRTSRAYRIAMGASAEATLPGQSGLARALSELWFNGRPMLVEVAIPALLMGLTFPLANAVIQQAEQSVGLRAGLLYLSNTAGAVWAPSRPASCSYRRSASRRVPLR